MLLSLSIDWLVGWLTGWFVGAQIGWPVGRVVLFDCSVGRSVNRLVCCLLVWWIGWLCCLVGRSVVEPFGRSVDWFLVGWLVG